MALFKGNTLSVSELNAYLKGMLEDDMLLRSFSLRGEIFGFKRHTSGHLYFSIKDEQAAMRCVMFRQNAMLLRIQPADGMRVVLSGYVSLFLRDGSLQFYCEGMKADGVGDLHLAFEQRKARLRAEGLFDLDRKRKLPAFPRRVAVVTSPTGAAIRDILRVAHRRHPGLDMVVIPSLVQGEEAASNLVSAMEKAASLDGVDVILLARGGGSIEDLWCFNDEALARCVAASKVPVVTGIGHEVDVTLADFAADVRAATPSQAAEIAVPDVSQVILYRESAQARLREGLLRQLSRAQERYGRLTTAGALRRPLSVITPVEQRFESLRLRMETVVKPKLILLEEKKEGLSGRLEALGPHAVLNRGYAIAFDREGRVLKRPDDVAVGEKLRVRLAKGEIAARREE